MICGVPEYLLYESLLYASRTSKWPGVTDCSRDLPGHHKYDPGNPKTAGIVIPAPQIHPGSDHDPGCFPGPADALQNSTRKAWFNISLRVTPL